MLSSVSWRCTCWPTTTTGTQLILAHHTALIDRSTLERWLNDGAHALRSLFSLAQQYRYSGTTRDDFAAKNAAARAALENSASCRRTCWKARAARALRHRSRGGRPSPARRLQRPPSSPIRRLPRVAQPMVRRAMRVLAHDSIAPISHSTRFVALEQADFQRLEHAGYLKGLLQPFKGKGSLETWASQCAAARRRDWPGAAARAGPGARLSLQPARRATGPAGHWRRTTFLRWRNLDRSSMGVALWEALLANPRRRPR